MVRVKQTPKKKKKRVALTTLSPTVREQFAPGFEPPPALPSERTWKSMMANLDQQYNTDQAMLDKYQEPTATQWDAIEAADPRYQRPTQKGKKTTTRKKAPPQQKAPLKKKKKKKRMKPPVRRGPKKVCLTLMELARLFPDIAKTVCFHPKVSSFKSVMSMPPSARRKVVSFLK